MENGQKERTNGTIFESARTMLIAAQLPFCFWPFTFRHTAYIFNRVTHKETKLTPFEQVFNVKPDVSSLHRFGCIAYHHDSNALKNLQPKAIKASCLGNVESFNGWWLWSPGTDRVFR